LRLGLRLIAGFPQAAAETIMAERREGPFTSFNDFARRTKLPAPVLQKLALADSFRSLGLSRRDALWQALPQQESLPLFDSAELEALPVSLPPMSPLQETLADYSASGLTLRDHPVSFLRVLLDELKVIRADQLATYPAEKRLKVAGLVLLRQRPATASGITFVTLEDETGIINLIVRPQVWERCRQAARSAKIMLAHGRLQRQGEIIHVLVTRIENLTPKLAEIQAKSRDFR
jgi:error-prone DNA polymerase